MRRAHVDHSRRSALKTIVAGTGAGALWPLLSEEAAAAFAHIQTTPVAGTRPDFSGVWVDIPKSHSRPYQSEGVPSPQPWSSPITIVQNSAAITVAYRSGARSHAAVLLSYHLDGTETTNTYGGTAPQWTARVHWEGQTLVLISNLGVPGNVSSGIKRYERRDELVLESATTLQLSCSNTLAGNTSGNTRRLQRTGPPSRRSAGSASQST
jgi:hypothetical protein